MLLTFQKQNWAELERLLEEVACCAEVPPVCFIVPKTKKPTAASKMRENRDWILAN